MPDWLPTALGMVAGILSTTSFLPQVKKAWQEGTESVSKRMYFVTVSAFVLWTAYGVLLGSLPLIVFNILSLLLSATILFLKIRNDRRGEGPDGEGKPAATRGWRALRFWAPPASQRVARRGRNRPAGRPVDPAPFPEAFRRPPMLLDPAADHDSIVDPRDAAESAGLLYVSDEEPGIRRRKAGKGFAYRGPKGEPVKDAATLKRIRSLAIPPAWTDVWICPEAERPHPGDRPRRQGPQAVPLPPGTSARSARAPSTST